MVWLCHLLHLAERGSPVSIQLSTMNYMTQMYEAVKSSEILIKILTLRTWWKYVFLLKYCCCSLNYNYHCAERVRPKKTIAPCGLRELWFFVRIGPIRFLAGRINEWMMFLLMRDKKLTKSQFSPTHASTERKITDELKHNAGWYKVREGSPVKVQWAVRWVGGWSMVGRICGTGAF